jgi:CRP/FNR family transcriptional regulator
MQTAQIARLIQNLPFFQGLDEDVLKRLAQEARVLRVQKREVIFRKGEACCGSYVIAYGRVRQSLFSNQGVEKPLRVIEAGGAFGDATLLKDRAHNTTAIALEDTALVFVPKATVLALLHADPQLTLRLLCSLAGRLHQVASDIEEFFMHSPGSRLASYLLRLVPPDAQEVSRVQLSLHKHLMAAQLNLTPETLSRYFREFCNLGLIELQGNCVTILDVRRLNQYAADKK